MGGEYNVVTEANETWLTPPEIVDALNSQGGVFDLDPACPENMPWRTAVKMLTKIDDGFSAEWKGEVWLNPPYGRETQRWIKRLADYNNGIALIFTRTSCKWFHKYVLDKALSLFLFDYRLRFCHEDGTVGKASSPAPSCLVAYGERSRDRLLRAVAQNKTPLTGTIINLAQ